METTQPKKYGPFELIEKIDNDGISEIFKAHSIGMEGFQKTVALKRITPQLSANPKFTEPLLQEIKQVISLRQANIVQTFDIGKERGCYYLSLEWIHGTSLASVFEKLAFAKKTLPLPFTLYLCAEISKALNYTHRKTNASSTSSQSPSLFHGALSPNSILIGKNGNIKVTGFGFSQALFRYNTHPEKSLLQKKFAYLSPEFALGSPVDFKTDIFSLGTIFFEMLLGKNPFQKQTPIETFNNVRIGKTENVREMKPKLPTKMVDCVNAMLSYEPGQRPAASTLYETLMELQLAEEKQASDESISAPIQKRLASFIKEL